jgi:hypothetical protein
MWRGDRTAAGATITYRLSAAGGLLRRAWHAGWDAGRSAGVAGVDDPALGPVAFDEEAR